MTPTRGWGGDGALGCVLGFGALHRVPAPLNEPMQAVGETLFETTRFSNEEQRSSATGENGFQPSSSSTPAPTSDFLVPADMQFSATSPPAPPTGDGPPKTAKKARAHHVVSPGTSMDDYFKEGEEKSKELEGRSTPKPGSTVPPPPKAGGPPKAAEPPAPAAEKQSDEKEE